MKTNFIHIFILSIALFTFTCATEIKNIAQAVNIAGKQRMYTQRMLKEYAMIGMGNTYSHADKNLEDAIRNFDTHLQDLLNFSPNDDIKKSITMTQEEWKDTKSLLLASPKKEIASSLQKKLEILLHLSDNTTKLYAKASGKASGEIINISGRQRMLSQRMASLYMLKAWGVNDAEFKKKLDEATKLFQDSLKKLLSSSLNTENITAILKEVDRSFMFFRIMNKSVSRFAPTLINKKSNTILTKMNTVTELYVKEEER